MKMLGFKLAHVGINCANKEEATKGAKLLCTLFGFEYKEGNSSTFTGSEFELMHAPYLGTNGHIAISTNFVDRAMAYLAKQGIEFNYETAKYDAKGNIKVIYLKDEICGFAIHLVEKK
jgi:2-dehydro-3-deoxyphosphogluconate aldolase/(4S)-4-hydroxy-2-oxoglutarate aldolase